MKNIIPENRDCPTLLSRFERWQNSNQKMLFRAKFYDFLSIFQKIELSLIKSTL